MKLPNGMESQTSGALSKLLNISMKFTPKEKLSWLLLIVIAITIIGIILAEITLQRDQFLNSNVHNMPKLHSFSGQ